MMRIKTVKKTVAAIIVIVLLVGASVPALDHKSKTNNGVISTSNNKSRTSYAAVEACSIFTSSAASQILGSSAVKENSPADTESTSDITFSNCIYSTGPNVDPPHMASVAVRSAKDSTGAASNKAVFTATGMPSGAQSVPELWR